MSIKDLKSGDIVNFTYKAQRSREPVQNVQLRVEDISDTHIKGINVKRILDGTQDTMPYRTYKLTNIVPNTVFLRIG